MKNIKALTCPFCGAPVPGNISATVIACSYCGQTFSIVEESNSTDHPISNPISMPINATSDKKGCGHTLRICSGVFFIILGAFGAWTDENDRTFGLGLLLFGITLLPSFHILLRQRLKINIPYLPILLPIAVFTGSAFLLN